MSIHQCENIKHKSSLDVYTGGYARQSHFGSYRYIGLLATGANHLGVVEVRPSPRIIR